MNDAKAILESFLAKHGAAWSPEDRELAARIIARSTELAALAAMGGDPTGELAQLKSQLASLAAAEATTTATIVQDSVQEALLSGLHVVIKGLGLIA